MLPAVEPQRPAFSLAGAGSVLIGFTAACVVAGTLIGWAVGKLGLGLAMGAVVGVPVGIRADERDEGVRMIGPHDEVDGRHALRVSLPEPVGCRRELADQPVERDERAVGRGAPDDRPIRLVIALADVHRETFIEPVRREVVVEAFVMVVVFAVAVSDKWLGLAAALTYAAGYSATLGLQLVAYYTGPVAGKAAQQ